MARDTKQNHPAGSSAPLWVRLRRKWRLGTALFLMLCVGIVVGWLLCDRSAHSPIVTALRESNLNSNTGYKFIDPLIGLKSSSPVVSEQYQPLQNRVGSFLADEISRHDVLVASVYFRDMAGSEGFTLNPAEKYNPASLMKVPTMMAYFKIAESDPAVLSKRLYFSGEKDWNTQEHFISPIQLEKGHWYTVEDLIDHMIKYSDNNAATLLVDNLNNTNHEDALSGLFRDLGITNIDLTDDFITEHSYALFFRVLYNSTYLGRDMSERAMKLLSQSDFSKGLDAGIPNDIVVSQKFGEFTIADTNGKILKRELHNCGVVYYPGHPYLLCVMTKGDDFQKLEDVISGVSRIVYEHFEKENI